MEPTPGVAAVPVASGARPASCRPCAVAGEDSAADSKRAPGGGCPAEDTSAAADEGSVAKSAGASRRGCFATEDAAAALAAGRRRGASSPEEDRLHRLLFFSLLSSCLFFSFFSFLFFFSFFCFLSRFAGTPSSVAWRAPWRGLSAPAVERDPTAGMAAMARRVVADARLNQKQLQRTKIKAYIIAFSLPVPTSDMHGQPCERAAYAVRVPCQSCVEERKLFGLDEDWCHAQSLIHVRAKLRGALTHSSSPATQRRCSSRMRWSCSGEAHCRDGAGGSSG